MTIRSSCANWERSRLARDSPPWISAKTVAPALNLPVSLTFYVAGAHVPPFRSTEKNATEHAIVGRSFARIRTCERRREESTSLVRRSRIITSRADSLSLCLDRLADFRKAERLSMKTRISQNRGEFESVSDINIQVTLRSIKFEVFP